MIMEKIGKERTGRHFEFGYPHFSRGIDYSWPNDYEKWEALLMARKEELEPILLENARKQMKLFGRRQDRGYPHTFVSERGVSIHLRDNDGHASICKGIGGAYFMYEHNLDSWIDRAIALNLGSKTLEFLDSGILAPRVLKEGEAYRLIYPLPQGVERLPIEGEGKYFLDVPLVARYFSLSEKDMRAAEERLKGEIKIDLSSQRQEIRTPKGLIVIKDGFCEGRDFQGFDNATASWVIAKLMNLCGPI